MMELKNKNIEKISHLTDSIKEELLEVWEKSVRSSHGFLTEDDIGSPAKVCGCNILNSSYFRSFLKRTDKERIFITCKHYFTRKYVRLV